MTRHVTVLTLLFATFGFAVPTRAQFEKLRNLTKSVTSEGSKTIACFKIKGTLVETPSDFPPIFGDEPVLSMKVLLERFKDARLDNNVVAVVVDLQQARLGLAQIQEIHQALLKFISVDKDVFVHADALHTTTYAAAAGASHISVVPTGDVWLTGIYGETPFLRGTLDKIGCTPDFEQFEEFKSAAEPLMRTEPSEPYKRMLKWLLDGIYDDLLKLIAESRGLSPEKVRTLIDDGPYTAEKALGAGLIDSVRHRQDFVNDLKTRYGSATKFVLNYGKRDQFDIPQDPFAMFTWLMQLLNPTPKAYTKPAVAIVYVEGMIQTGSAEFSPFGPAEGAYSTTIRKALDKAADDDNVKTVVLRIDSPGGSALASEIILDATKRVAAKKPLIVSMGNVAGSGGYYVTCGAETIFAQSGTITASIGVIGGKLVTTPMWHKLGVNWHISQRGRMAGMLASDEPFDEAERAKLRSYMGSIYEIFKQHVVKARGSRLTKPINEIAGGRVFTGAQALELGLIDKIGGLEEAVKFAAQRAGISDYEIRIIPEPFNIFDLFKRDRDEDEFVFSPSARPARLTDSPMFQAVLPTLYALDPLRGRAALRAMKGVELIHQEPVIMMMPTEILIR